MKTRACTVAALAVLVGGCETLKKASTPPEAPGNHIYPVEPYARNAHFDASLAKARLAERPADDRDAVQARALLKALLARDSELAAWVFPHLYSYLPPGRDLPLRVYLGYGLKSAVSSDENGAVYVDVGAREWAGSVDRLWTAMVREQYHAAIDSIGATAPEAPEDAQEVTAAVLERVLGEGMPAYVASHGRPDFIGVETYEVLDRRAEVSERFLVLRDLLRPLNGSESPHEIEKRWKALIAVDKERRVFAVVGAYMAEIIEREQGRQALARAVGRGPRAFYAAYQELAPGALVSFVLPEEGTERMPSGPLLSH